MLSVRSRSSKGPKEPFSFTTESAQKQRAQKFESYVFQSQHMHSFCRGIPRCGHHVTHVHKHFNWFFGSHGLFPPRKASSAWRNQLTRRMFLGTRKGVFKICTQLWVCLFALSWKIILLRLLRFFDAEESIDPRSEIRFWIFPKIRTLR